MCFSMCAQVLYGVIMFICLALTLGAMFTSNWRKIGDQLTDEVKKDALQHRLPDHMGIFPFACRMPGSALNVSSTVTGLQYCEDWWNNLKTWEKVVIAAMVLAVLFEAFALLWNIFTWCACCCKQFLLHPLSLASFGAAISLAVAVVVYGMKNQNVFDGIEGWKDIESKITTEVGYSFWLAVGALVLAIADVVVGTCAVCLGESCV